MLIWQATSLVYMHTSQHSLSNRIYIVTVTSSIDGKAMGSAASHTISDCSYLALLQSLAIVAEQISYYASGIWPCTLHDY
jgi:hypothetical protein